MNNDTAEVYWLMPLGGTPEHVTWDQIYSPDGAISCGEWYQVDLYPVDAIPGLIADGVLSNGEDHGIAISWRFEQAPACEPEPTPTPTPEPTPEVTPTPTPVVITPTDTPTTDIPATETVTTVENTASDVPTLAETGAGDILMPAVLAIAFLAAGSSMLLRNKLAHKK